MLSKLAVRNAKRSIKDYIIYLITVTLAFSFIFAFNLISDAKSIVELSSMMQNFKLGYLKKGLQEVIEIMNMLQAWDFICSRSYVINLI